MSPGGGGSGLPGAGGVAAAGAAPSAAVRAASAADAARSEAASDSGADFAGAAGASAGGFATAGFAGAGLAAAAGLGGATVAAGCVVQKCRAQRGQTQNCCGAQGAPGSGSRSSMAVPQRWHVSVCGFGGASGAAGVANASSDTIWMIPPLTRRGESEDNCSLMIPAIILSGGASRRMGRPKALLTISGETFLARIVRVLREAGIGDIVVVTGAHHDDIVAHLATVADRHGRTPSIRIERNPDPDGDQLSSLRVGLAGVADGGAGAVLVALVDHPLIDPATVCDMIDACEVSAAPIVRPACNGRHGHPVIFARETFAMLLHGALPDGAKGVLRAFEERQVFVPTTNRGVVVDVDTPDAYRELEGADVGDDQAH